MPELPRAPVASHRDGGSLVAPEVATFTRTAPMLARELLNPFGASFSVTLPIGRRVQRYKMGVTAASTHAAKFEKNGRAAFLARREEDEEE